MNRRSKTNQLTELTPSLIKEIQQFEVNIDFDEASEAWKTNKKSIGNGSYKYVCPFEKNKKKCGKSCYKGTQYCWQHRKYVTL